jgi:hypothetical protein
MTRMFESESEAKNFARAKFDEGLTVYAGTVNPVLPKRLIPSDGIPSWLDSAQMGRDAKPDAGDTEQQ